LKRLISLCVSVGLLALLFYKVDRTQLVAYLRHTHWGWFALGLLMFIPQMWLSAVMWKRLVGLFTHISTGESLRQILASNTMNLVLPSKLGDLTKGVFLQRKGCLDLSRAMNIVIFEKMLDVAALASIMLLGVVAVLAGASHVTVPLQAIAVAGLLAAAAVGAVAVPYFIPLDAIPGFRPLLGWLSARPRLARVERFLRAGHETTTLLQSRGAPRGLLCGLAFAKWITHLLQIYFFFIALGARPLPLLQFLTMVPLAIFIGLIPITIAGFGTRDGALIAFFPQFPSSLMLGVALYVNLRYILPALAGMPYLNRYLVYARQLRAPACDNAQQAADGAPTK